MTTPKNRQAIILAAVFFFFSVPARATDNVQRSTENISPFGDYQELQIRRTLKTGIAATAPAGTVSNAALSTVDIYGSMNILGNLGNPPGTSLAVNWTITKGSEVDVFEIFEVKNGASFPAFETYPNSTATSHWFGINVDPSSLVGTPGCPRAELEVNGDIYASAFRASPITSTYSDYLLYFKMATVTVGAVTSAIVELGSSFASNATGYGNSESVVRFCASPNIVLNGVGAGYSSANVLIGTTVPAGVSDSDPNYKLQIGAAGSTLYAIGHAWNLFSSRDFKKDISLFTAQDTQALFSKIDQLNIVRFHYKEAKPGSRLETGVIAEEAPKELVTEDGKALSTTDAIGFLVAGVQGLQKEKEALEKRIAELERQTNEWEASNRRL